jgi:hypothetical protein
MKYYVEVGDKVYQSLANSLSEARRIARRIRLTYRGPICIARYDRNGCSRYYEVIERL